MYKPSMYLLVTYFPTYVPIYKTYFLQNWLPRWNQILTQVRFILPSIESPVMSPNMARFFGENRI
jgi:hypothetical protein